MFANYSWLDSDVDDEFGSRRFNSQSEYVYNFGFIHDLVGWDAAFGATYRKQGDAVQPRRRRGSRDVVWRVTGSVRREELRRQLHRALRRLQPAGLRPRTKRSTSIALFASQAAGAIDDEYELETEEAGPV